MPSITAHKSDLEQLLGAPVALDVFSTELEVAKAELKSHDPATGELRIELNDTNRPDLWSPEGIARLLGARRRGHGATYDFFATGAVTRQELRISVDPGLRDIRPFVAGFVATGVPLDDPALRALIQSQEKLAENYGRKRSAVAIGAYRADLMRFPVHYRAADPDRTRFTPLEFDAALSLREILDRHPKGREYGHLIQQLGRYPLLTDENGHVLSMPPIINSQELGQVVIGDANLFVEVTGHDLRQLILALNIAAVDLADRGARIEPVTVEYPYDTPFGRQVVTPLDFAEPLRVDLDAVERMLGERVEGPEVTRLLEGMAYRDVRIEEQTLELTPPPYRDDLLHTVDVLEDVAIARDINSFEPILPQEFTVGRLSPEEELCRQVRTHLLGAGFQEVVSNILTSSEALAERMRLTDEGAFVEIENAMSAGAAVLRNSQIPSLLAVEAVSSKALYPHRMFEIGEVVIVDPDAILRSRTQLRITALLAHARSTVSELQSTLEALCFYMERDYELESRDHPSFMEGRCGLIRMDGNKVGWIGELHPECLERWGIAVPSAAFELELSALAEPS